VVLAKAKPSLAANASPPIGTGLCEAKTGQAKPDWPVSAEWLPEVLSSLVSAANLSTTLFLNGLCLPDEVGTGLAEGEIGCEFVAVFLGSNWPFSGS